MGMGFTNSPRFGFYYPRSTRIQRKHLTIRTVLPFLFAMIFVHIIVTLNHAGYADATSISFLSFSWKYKDSIESLRPYLGNYRVGSGSSGSGGRYGSGSGFGLEDISRGGYDSSIDSTLLNPIANANSNNPFSANANTNTDTLLTGTTRRKASAALVMLARNSELSGVVHSMKQLEAHFNERFGYDWVFLNDVEFSKEFVETTRNLTKSKVSYGLVPSHQWNQPEWIDETRAEKGRKELVDKKIIYGDSVSYRNMCRFYSGFFFKHPLLLPYRYYWRVEPNIEYFCDVHYDPFLMMQDHGKVYGFTISLIELKETITSLWDTVKDFVNMYPQYLAPNNSLGFLSDDKGETYNLCHFWSNFEIGDMEFWRGEAYTKFFEHLEATGGFYYERWGDAPIHSIAASLFARNDQIHFFRDIGYRHEGIRHCPVGGLHRHGKCRCSGFHSFDYKSGSCLSRFEKVEEAYAS